MKPKVSTDNFQRRIIEAIKNNYKISVGKLRRIPVGEESESFKVTSGEGKRYFVKYSAKKDVIHHLATANKLLIELHQLGINYLVPPISIDNITEFDFEKGKIYIYPFVEGVVLTCTNLELPKNIITQLTSILADLYKISNRITTPLPTEKYSCNYTERFEDLKKERNAASNKLLKNNEGKITTMLKQFDSLATKFKDAKIKNIVTHGDVTGLNIIQTESGIVLTDWDGTMLAPKERDLNFLKGNKHFSPDDYLNKSGADTYNEKLVCYYDLKWSLGSILGRMEHLLKLDLTEKQTKETEQKTLEYLSYY